MRPPKQPKMVTKFTMIQCASCSMPFYAPDHFIAQRRKDGDGFKCPAGHSNVYTKQDPNTVIEDLKKQVEAANKAAADAKAQLESFKALHTTET